MGGCSAPCRTRLQLEQTSPRPRQVVRTAPAPQQATFTFAAPRRRGVDRFSLLGSGRSGVRYRQARGQRGQCGASWRSCGEDTSPGQAGAGPPPGGRPTSHKQPLLRRWPQQSLLRSCRGVASHSCKFRILPVIRPVIRGPNEMSLPPLRC